MLDRYTAFMEKIPKIQCESSKLIVKHTKRRGSTSINCKASSDRIAFRKIQVRNARLTDLLYSCVVEDQIRAEDEIKRAEQYEALKQSLLRLLDDPQVQQKIVILLRRWLGAHPRK